MRAICDTYPAICETRNRGIGAHSYLSIVSLYDHLKGSIRDSLRMLMADVRIILLIACANIANLPLSCRTARSREFTLRAALDASPPDTADTHRDWKLTSGSTNPPDRSQIEFST